MFSVPSFSIIAFCIRETQVSIYNDIIIISVKIHSNPDDKCQSDYILKAVYNKRLLLLESMAGVREIADTCTIPRRFIDFILRQKAIDLAQENNDIDLLCKYFKMFSGSIGTNKIEFAPCGCLRGWIMISSNCNNLSNKVSGMFKNYFTYLSKVGYKKDDAALTLVVITFLHDLLDGKYND